MSRASARIWPFVPAALLAAMLAGLGTMAVIAVDDPGFALERDYYQKAVSYDAEMAQRAQNARLGWTGTLSVERAGSDPSWLSFGLRDARGPVTDARVRVEALRNASASLVLEATLVERSPGEYRAALPLRQGGVWEFRFTAVRAGETFTDVQRREVGDAP